MKHLPAVTAAFAAAVLVVTTCLPAGNLLALAAPQAPAANTLRISQVYGGGGNSGAPYNADFIELFNAGATAVNLNGWSVQYASATGTFNNVTALGNVTIPAWGYLLVGEYTGSSGAALPAPDASGSINMSATNGKVALATNTTGISGKDDPDVVDFVGYGTANAWEGDAAAPAGSNTTSVQRAGAGCTDTDQNGNDSTAAAPVPRNSASPENICGDAAPFVAGATPAEGAAGVALAASITITFSENMDVAGTWYQILCNLSGDHAATVSGGPRIFTLDPGADFVTGDFCRATIYADQVGDQDGDDPPDAMVADYVWNFDVSGAPAACSTIPRIQGLGSSSPCLGTVTNIAGCITGIGAAGFYFQADPGDGSALTSDGLYVYRGSTWTNPSGWAPGDRVNVSGTIIEYYDTTEFQAGNTVSRTGSCTVPAAAPVAPVTDPAADPMAQYERYESMRVSMSFDGWVVGATKRYDSRFPVSDPETAFVDYGSTIPDDSRVFERDYPGYQGLSYLSGALNVDLPDLDFGDRVSGTAITGVLGYTFDKYALLLDGPQTLATVDRPDVTSSETPLDPAQHELDVCFWNAENLFDNLNDGQGDWGDWAPGYPNAGTPAGAALYQAGLAGRAEIIVDKLKSCQVIGLQEVEGKQQVYDDLASHVSLSDTLHTWTAIFVESGDSRDISQGFLYRDDVTLVSGPASVSGAPYTGWAGDGALDFVRVPAMAVFRFQAGTPFEVDLRLLSAHFKSKSSSALCSTPDCTDRREKEAADMRDILTHYRDAGEFAIAGGDFNDTFGSTPIAILDASTAIQNLWYDLPERERYSYVFSGESEVLDHLYATANLPPALARSFNVAHVLADFPSSERVSDHDPLRARFHVNVDLGDTTGYGDAWHRAPHTVTLGASVSDDLASATGTDDATDTGVTRAGAWHDGAGGGAVNVVVAGTGNGCLHGWIDWNGDGDYADTLEHIVDGGTAGTTGYAFEVPAGTFSGAPPDRVFNARFRLYATCPVLDAPAASTGGEVDGEVEDYHWTFSPTAISLARTAVTSGAGVAPAALALAACLAIAARALTRRR